MSHHRSLGNGRYLEILAPAESQPPGAPRDPRVQYGELTLVGWALQTRAIGDVVARLRAAGFIVDDPMPGSRRAPDGGLLRWQMAVVGAPGLEGAPFFIEWGSDTTHPSLSSPAGCTLVGMELAHPEPARLQSFFRAVAFRATLAVRQRPDMRLTLDCPRGRVDFTT